ncbi:MAG: 5-methylcytosine-specific restriction endonuclease system specificity protein McrC [Bacteroidales bacterium]|nr:5-methylcytosine-specific restriction endonuclease system specificity protein McrC [Bacteroidales bacterium]
MMNGNILVKNVYYMLCYAYQVLRQPNFKGAETEEFENVQNLYASILCRGVGQLIKQGLYREYANHTDDVSCMRGKILMPESVRHKVAKRHLLCCEYDELSENNLYNRILKSALDYLVRSDKVDTGLKNTLKKEIQYFSDVDEVDLGHVSWSRINFRRGNQVYYMLINICRLLYEGRLLTTESGENDSVSFDELQMSSLYEKFVLGYYSVHYPQLSPADSCIRWAIDYEDKYPDELYTMHTDATLSRGGDVLIIDTKYYTRITHKRFGMNKLNASNLYQIFAYVKNKDAELSGREHSVSGMLLYARTDEDFIPNQTYNMSGNRIDVRTIDLNTDFSEIKDQLDAIVRDFFGETIRKVG